ncbi:chromosome segregation protein SMC [Ligilactobacillus salitolerans]|uniref:Chromosome partition protein Smc n=1 Tax=Ligilactobacillus salitolerans TaxID=1808352 RepID=A0A401IRK8_9LACO|nr:chromosome segregation protein SMC [Ligilactobacillus salitolerans]GBG94135.1 chromosome segregation protein SMC [Ligilactobacillus salitolerans]
MKLKALTLNGFKSFADQTKIEFNGGLTGIVGPNGSGKSNIIDALRWTLGEQSAKSLRGDKMADVIFGGSESRAALNRAEVTLEFDNSDQTLQGLPEEVVICRRLYRSGESEFLINNKNVRLRDINELFMDTGVSRNSFSIISQGKVEAVFNSKPEERRSLIEEAAGISKYKKEKQKAQTELLETTDHLDRVADIIGELESQKAPLEEQASLARDYLAQKKQFDHFELSNLVLTMANLREEIDHTTAQLNSNELLSKKYERQKAAQEQVTEKLTAQSEQLENKLSDLQNNLLEFSKQKERISGKKEMSQQEQEFHRTRVQELEGQLAENQTDFTDAQQRFDQLEEQVTEKKRQLAQYQNALTELEKQQQTSPADLAATIENLRSKILTMAQEQSALQSKLEYLTDGQKNEQGQSLQHKKALSVQKEALEELRSRSERAKEDLAAWVEKLNQLQEKQSTLKQEEAELTKEYETKKNQWYAASDILHRAKAQLNALDNVAANYSGYYQGAKNILQARSDVSGVVGAVAELLQLEAKYSKAIETVLGGQLQNVVTTNEQAAKKAIAYLNQHRAGRATFLPRTAVKARSLPLSLSEQLTSMPGFLGIASDLVEVQPEDQVILEYLLGTTIVVQDLDAAVQIAKMIRHQGRIVTLNGEIINAGGSMTGGTSQHKRTGLLEQKQQREKLSADIQKMQDQLKNVELAGKQTSADLETKKARQKNLAEQLAEVQEKKAQAAEKAAGLALEIEHGQESYEQAQHTWQEQSQIKEKRALQIKSIQSQQKETANKLAELQTALAEKQTATTAAADSQKQYEKKAAQLKQDAALERERLDSLQIQLKEVQNQKLHLDGLIKKQTAMIKELKEQTKVHASSDHDLAIKVSQLEESIQQATSALEALTQQRAEIKAQLNDEKLKLQRVTGLREAARDEQQKNQVQLSRLSTLLDRNLTDLSEKYGMTYEYAKQQELETDPTVVARQLKLLKMGLDDLGEVNLGAIKEYDRVNERYEFLAQQQNDLLTAKSQLESSMYEMDQEVKQRFKQTFERVAEAFRHVFPQIFEGGSAYLSLTDPSDLLHTGIEITAQPPGKKAQQLSLLSGGERTLTAIALLFAILEVTPVPFAILDEAEAALDDANVTRYSQYLRRLDDHTQFIVITHRKGTMVQADVLYGVTMQDSGVSRMVSVSLADVI